MPTQAWITDNNLDHCMKPFALRSNATPSPTVIVVPPRIRQRIARSSNRVVQDSSAQFHVEMCGTSRSRRQRQRLQSLESVHFRRTYG